MFCFLQIWTQSSSIRSDSFRFTSFRYVQFHPLTNCKSFSKIVNFILLHLFIYFFCPFWLSWIIDISKQITKATTSITTNGSLSWLSFVRSSTHWFIRWPAFISFTCKPIKCKKKTANFNFNLSTKDAIFHRYHSMIRSGAPKEKSHFNSKIHLTNQKWSFFRSAIWESDGWLF